ncbi:MAG: NosD domain-containing protein [Planctomycetota bacterium]|jgi:parallel beta-helix repeat protein
MKIRIIPIIFFIIPAMGISATIHVPGDYSTIQEAIDAASAGDTVLVASGTYVENINFIGKAITVISEEGPDVTIIDGGSPANPDNASVVSFWNGEGPDSVLEGFTLTASHGGGIGFWVSCHPAITNNTIEDNIATSQGAGIFFTHSCSPIIDNNIINGNSAVTFGGGIEYAFDCSPTITNNVIEYNTAGEGGGGIVLRECSGIIEANFISNNSASGSDWGGGGLLIFLNSFPTVSNNVIHDNSALMGAGIHCKKCFPVDAGDSVDITNNLIFNNTADEGGGIYSEYSSLTMMNSTLYGNSAKSGGGIAYLYDSSATVTNTILWNNDAPEGKEILIGNSVEPSMLSIDYSDVEGGQASVEVDTGCTLVWDYSSMIKDDPQFEYPSIGDFHLTWLSPCINRGTNDGAAPEDMDGDLRPWVGTADMGADEFTGTHPLEADKFSVSETSGGTVNFAIFGDTPNAGRNYLLLGSVSGTCPGTALPGGLETLRLNKDWFTDLELLLLGTPLFLDFHGKLDVWGNAAAQLNLPPLPPGTAGITMHYAYCLNNPFDFVSNPVAVEVVP